VNRFDVEAFAGRLRVPLGDAGTAALAAMWPVTTDRLASALVDGGLVLEAGELLDVWLVLGELLTEVEVRAVMRADMAGPAGDVIFDVALGADHDGLQIPEDLAGLPLMALAVDVARYQPSGRLTVTSRRLAGEAGLYTRIRSGGVIVLDAGLDDDRRADVWAHELAHALDPLYRDSNVAGAEAFAYLLGPWLLETGPETVAQAGFLVGRALRETAGVRRMSPASSALEDVLNVALAGVVTPQRDDAPVAACRRLIDGDGSC